MRLRHLIPCSVFALLCTAAVSASSLAASSDDPDWPCIQRKIPQISAGMVWAGPAVDELQKDWRQDSDIAQLAGTLARRAVPLDEAEAMIADFAAGLESDKNETLTLLFTGTLAVINRTRGSLINGIGRYAKRQAALAERIRSQTAALHALPAGDNEEASTKRAELREQILWDTRIFKEREDSLIYVCEQPVLLEQRVFALSRAIMNHLD